VVFLRGLSDDDALALWRAAGITGACDALVPLFRSIEGHPLLVRALAGEIARDRKSPGDFDKWKERHPDFNPFAQPLVQRKSHVLGYALQGLGPDELAVLKVIAGFRMPAAYETLAALLVGKDTTRWYPFSKEDAFDRALADLDDRGLVGWDRPANRYDLHPIVRGVVWSGVAEDARQGIAEWMRVHFEPMRTAKWTDVERIEDLTPAIELYFSLIRLQRYDDAFHVFSVRLDDAMHYRLGASRQRVELLEMLFPYGFHIPLLRDTWDRRSALNALGRGYFLSGQPGRAALCFWRATLAEDDEDDETVRARRYGDLSVALQQTGALHDAEVTAFRALAFARAERDEMQEAASLVWVGMSRAIRGVDVHVVLRRSIAIWRSQEYPQPQPEGVISRLLALLALWRGDATEARRLANQAWELASSERAEFDFIRAACMQGKAALHVGDVDVADERLHHALTRARASNGLEQELEALTSLAALHLHRGDSARAREHLDAMWDAAERGPYPLLHADAGNVLAEIEIAEKNIPAAVAAATAAYRLAWCDGPPFAYDYGLRTARAHLAALGAAEPELPPYDPSKHEPIEEIDFEPDGEQAQ
jgi:hypothetical protein